MRDEVLCRYHSLSQFKQAPFLSEGQNGKRVMLAPLPPTSLRDGVSAERSLLASFSALPPWKTSKARKT
jgi:hypothetical protein